MQVQAHLTDQPAFASGSSTEKVAYKRWANLSMLSQSFALCCRAVAQEAKGEGGNGRAAERAVCIPLYT